MKNTKITGTIILALLLTSFLVGCGSDNDNNDNVTIAISSTTTSTNVGTATTPFTVTVTGSDNKNYTVSATPAGSGCPSGAQTSNTFTCTPTATGTYTITVTSSADTSKTTSATLTAVPGFSEAPPTASTVCAEPIGTGVNKARIAVASNFYYPAQSLVKDWFQASSLGTGTSVIVCHNSTGNLRTEINGGYKGYTMLFTADETAQNFNTADVEAFVYAKGVPVLAAKKEVISSVTELVTGVTAGDVATIDAAPAALSASYQIITATAEKVSIADPGGAPYGVAAQLIFNNMMSVNIPSTMPSWVFTGGNVAANGLWNNIDNTYSAVINNSVTVSGTAYPTSDVKSGLLGKSQICGEIAPNAATPSWVYVEFTHPDFIRNQKAILLDSENTAASKLNDYIQGAMVNGDWGDFLFDNCYMDTAD